MIKPIRASVTFEYNPDSYIEYCEESGQTPTQEDFRKFIESDIREDFNTAHDPYIEVIE
jgi:hypothetical protein